MVKRNRMTYQRRSARSIGVGQVIPHNGGLVVHLAVSQIHLCTRRFVNQGGANQIVGRQARTVVVVVRAVKHGGFENMNFGLARVVPLGVRLPTDFFTDVHQIGLDTRPLDFAGLPGHQQF